MTDDTHDRTAALPMLEALHVTAGNIRSLGPARALDGVPMEYREWLACVEEALAMAIAPTLSAAQRRVLETIARHGPWPCQGGTYGRRGDASTRLHYRTAAILVARRVARRDSHDTLYLTPIGAAMVQGPVHPDAVW